MAQKKERIKITTPPGIFEWPRLNKVNYGSKQFPVKDGNFETRIIIDTTHPEYEAFVAKLEPLYAQAKAIAEKAFGELPVANRKELKAKNPDGGIRLAPMIKQMYDEDTEELLTTVKAKFTMKAGGKRKDGTTWFARPTAFSGSLKPIPLFVNAPGTPYHGLPHPKAKAIYSGTRGRVSFEVEDGEYMAYFNASEGSYGIRASLQSVQILSYGAAPQRSGTDYGFAAEEGYDGEDIDDTWSADDFANTAPTTEQGGGAAGDNGGDF